MFLAILSLGFRMLVRSCSIRNFRIAEGFYRMYGLERRGGFGRYLGVHGRGFVLRFSDLSCV